MKPLIDYSRYFRNNVLIITGVGRSGTTILGKVIGSMRNTVYLFEPAIMKYMPMLWNGELREPLHADGLPRIIPFQFYPDGYLEQMFLGTLFEDYILPFVQCRGGMSHNPDDWTYWGNYMTERECQIRQQLSGRGQAIDWIIENKPLFVIKVNEAKNLLPIFEYLFYGCKYIHIMRNGFDVIASSLDKGWFGNDYQAIEFATGNVPLFVNKDARRYWPSYDPTTKAACAWRCLIDIPEKDDCWTFSYEQFCADPEVIIGQLEMDYGMKTTAITQNHIESIKQFQCKEKQSVTLDDIGEPERGKFETVMKGLGYL